MRKSMLLAALALLMATPMTWGTSHENESSKRQARVAGGAVVEYAGSSLSDEDWAERRPNFAALKPKARDE